MPIVFIIVPFIVDMTNGGDVTADIIMQRGIAKDDIQ